MASQFTPFTCALDLFSGYLRELGFDVFTHDILTNHRDLCLGDHTKVEIFGALAPQHFEHLVTRYLLRAQDIDLGDTATVSAAIADGHGVFVFCSRFEGTIDHNHAIRVVAVENAQYTILVPGFPHSQRQVAAPSTIKNDWRGAGVVVHP